MLPRSINGCEKNVGAKGSLKHINNTNPVLGPQEDAWNPLLPSSSQQLFPDATLLCTQARKPSPDSNRKRALYNGGLFLGVLAGEYAAIKLPVKFPLGLVYKISDDTQEGSCSTSNAPGFSNTTPPLFSISVTSEFTTIVCAHDRFCVWWSDMIHRGVPFDTLSVSRGWAILKVEQCDHSAFFTKDSIRALPRILADVSKYFVLCSSHSRRWFEILQAPVFFVSFAA